MSALDIGTLGLLIPLLAVGLGIGGWIIVEISKNTKEKAQTREREQTRREVAAYVAEGSMTPEEGNNLLGAGEPKKA